MFGSTVLDVIIGLVFAYSLLSLLASAVTEGIVARFMLLRHKGLMGGVRDLLDGPAGKGISELFFNHPLIRSLRPKPGTAFEPPSESNLPSYIPARAFASAVFDLLLPTQQGGVTEPISKRLAAVPESDPKRWVVGALLPMAEQAGEDMEKFRREVEHWFEDSMARVGGWYKRRSTLVLLAVGAAIVLATNADTLLIIQKLSKDRALRERTVAQAVASLKENPNPKGELRKLRGEDPPEPYGEDYWEKEAVRNDLQVRQTVDQLNALGLLGWEVHAGESAPTSWSGLRKSLGGTPGGVLQKIVGLALTIIAISFGAPFWFDLLNRLVNLRTSGPKPASAKDKEYGKS